MVRVLRPFPWCEINPPARPAPAASAARRVGATSCCSNEPSMPRSRWRFSFPQPGVVVESPACGVLRALHPRPAVRVRTSTPRLRAWSPFDNDDSLDRPTPTRKNRVQARRSPQETRIHGPHDTCGERNLSLFCVVRANSSARPRHFVHTMSSRANRLARRIARDACVSSAAHNRPIFPEPGIRFSLWQGLVESTSSYVARLVP